MRGGKRATGHSQGGAAPPRADVSIVYNDDDWRALSRRLALKLPNLPAVRFSRALIVTCALLLIVVGILTWLDSARSMPRELS